MLNIDAYEAMSVVLKEIQPALDATVSHLLRRYLLPYGCHLAVDEAFSGWTPPSLMPEGFKCWCVNNTVEPAYQQILIDFGYDVAIQKTVFWRDL
jgi:hypothetical protein